MIILFQEQKIKDCRKEDSSQSMGNVLGFTFFSIVKLVFENMQIKAVKAKTANRTRKKDEMIIAVSILFLIDYKSKTIGKYNQQKGQMSSNLLGNFFSDPAQRPACYS